MNKRAIALTVAAVVVSAAIVGYAVLSKPAPAQKLSSHGAPVVSSSVDGTSAAAADTTDTGSVSTTGGANTASGGTAQSGTSSGGTGTNATKPVVPAVPVVPVTLSTAQRKACYMELVQAEDRAVAEAEAKYPLNADPPNIDAHMTLRFSLIEKYEKAVADKYGITMEQAAAITVEGTEQGWPMPPL